MGVVLVGRGSLYSRQPARELESLAEHLRSSNPRWVVAEALLEQEEPSLPDALVACSQAGVEKVVILPAFMPVEVATRNWMRYVAHRWLEQSAAPVQVAFADPLAGQALVAKAAIESVRKASLSANPLASVSEKAGAPDPDWSVIPPHRNHVLFCQGPRCASVGAGELGAYFRKLLKESGLDDGPDHVLAARTGCLYPCNLGPVMVVYPEGIWYCGLDKAVISQIVDQHFQRGEVVTAQVFRPSSVPQSLAIPATLNPNSIGE